MTTIEIAGGAVRGPQEQEQDAERGGDAGADALRTDGERVSYALREQRRRPARLAASAAAVGIGLATGALSLALLALIELL